MLCTIFKYPSSFLIDELRERCVYKLLIHDHPLNITQTIRLFGSIMDVYLFLKHRSLSSDTVAKWPDNRQLGFCHLPSISPQ
jgi:uncharacterized protein YpmS